MPKIISISYNDANPEGTGAGHRAYQIQCDVSQLHESLNYEYLKFERKDKKENCFSHYLIVIQERLVWIPTIFGQKFNPHRVISALVENSQPIKRSLGWVPLDAYKEYIHKTGKPNVCIVDHPSYVEIARFNKNNSIATIYCPNDLLSFSRVSNRFSDTEARRQGGINWLVEQEFLSLCDEYLMISNVEKHFLDGLGLPATFFPYLPVGQIRERLITLRKSRGGNNIDQDLILMIGSVFWGPIGEGFRWVLRNIQKEGLPKGKRMIVGGRGAEKLISEFGPIEGVEIRDRLPQEELDALLSVAGCMLIPQRSGFGAVTRTPEMACAGIPCITTEHAAAAMNIPPGVHVVLDTWNTWNEAMIELAYQPLSNSLEDYEMWEKDQPKPLTQVIKKYLP